MALNIWPESFHLNFGSSEPLVLFDKFQGLSLDILNMKGLLSEHLVIARAVRPERHDLGAQRSNAAGRTDPGHRVHPVPIQTKSTVETESSLA
eukprot:4283073-Amphidinium_carterae.1